MGSPECGTVKSTCTSSIQLLVVHLLTTTQSRSTRSGGTALFQELDSSHADALAFSAQGWTLNDDGQVVMRFVHAWGDTDCALQRTVLSDQELAACWNNVGILQDNYNDSLVPFVRIIIRLTASRQSRRS